MKFDLDTAWRDARRLARDNAGLLAALAGVFMFIPYALLFILLPRLAPFPELPEGAGLDAQMAALNAYYADTWWAFAIVAAIVTIGQLAMLALLGRRTSPTVAEAIAIGGKALVPVWLAFILLSAGMNLVVGVLVLVVGLTGLEGLVYIATLAALVWELYLLARFTMILPIVAVEGGFNPLRAMRAAWELTRGKGGRLLAFYVLLALAAFALLIVVLLLTGLVLSLGGPQVAETGSTLVMAAALTALVTLATTVIAAIHRQLRRLEHSTPSVPPSGLRR